MRFCRLLFFCLFLSIGFADESILIDSEELDFDPESGMAKAARVKIEYVDGSLLTSPYGELDTRNRSALFTSDGENLVEYRGRLENTKRDEQPFSLRCQKMLVDTRLTPIGDTLVEISAKGNVFLEIPGRLKGEGDFAQLVREGEEMRQFLFTAIHPEKRCTLTDPIGNQIQAVHIEMDMNSSKVNCQTANGTFFHDGIPLNFFCEELEWDDQHRHILLRGDVLVDCQGFGMMTCSEEMEICLSPGETKQLMTISAKGKSTCYHLNESHSIKHTILCDGKMQFHREKMRLTMLGKNGSPVKFQDELGEIEAAKVAVWFFEEPGNRIVPSKVIMKGDVRMKNIFSEFFQEDVLTEQYAVADRVIFDTINKEATFRAAPKKRVLFYNQTNGLQVSAPELVMYRGAGIHPNIEGKGNVRLKLSDKEMETLSHAF